MRAIFSSVLILYSNKKNEAKFMKKKGMKKT